MKGKYKMKEIILKVEGMVCGGCEKRVENILSSLEGIETVEASHEENMVKIKLNKDLNIDLIKEKIEDLGFEVK